MTFQSINDLHALDHIAFDDSTRSEFSIRKIAKATDFTVQNHFAIIASKGDIHLFAVILVRTAFIFSPCNGFAHDATGFYCRCGRRAVMCHAAAVTVPAARA